jgi:hypothetical protein
MTGPLSDHEEVEVGGDLDADRLRAIMVRGFLLRNLAISAAEAFTYPAQATYPGMVDGVPPWSAYGGTQHTDGETPTLVWDAGDGGETRMPSHEVHVGCGELCPVFAVVPWDGDSGGVPSENARAIAHAGRDLIDLVREVVMLRSAVVMKAHDPDTVLLVDMPTTVDRETAQRMLHSLIQATGCSALGMTLPTVPLPRGDVEGALAMLTRTMTDAAAAHQLRADLETILPAATRTYMPPNVGAAAERIRALLDIAIPDSGPPVADGDGST